MSIWDLKRPYFVYYEGPGPLSEDGIKIVLSNLLEIRSWDDLESELPRF